MKKLILPVLFVLIGSIAEARQVTPLKGIWDYPDAEIWNVSEFQVKLDDGAYISVGIPTAVVFSDTLEGNKSYVYQLPTFDSGGAHTFYVRACNIVECSWDAFASFRLIGAPKNLRIKQ